LKLTEKVIASLACDGGKKDRLVFDDALPGLGIRVSASGSKNFLVQYRAASGSKRRLPIGVWGAVTLDQARQAAKTILGQVAAGRDPFGDRRADRKLARFHASAERLTLKTLISEWSEVGLAARRESYRREAVRAISVAFADFLDRRADGLQRADIVRVSDRLVKVGKRATAGRTQAYGRACYSWAVRRGRLEANPFIGLPIVTDKARDRVLTDLEVGAIYRGAAEMPYPFGPLVQLLLLTSQRREEVAGMRWSEISADRAIWTIPADRSKNGKTHIVHLTAVAQAVFDRIPRDQTTDLVFTTNGKRSVSGFSKMRVRLGKTIAASSAQSVNDDWRVHDFRRTCVTWLAGAGFNTGVADKLLNHQTATGLSTVGAVYQRSQFLPERKAALERWGAHVLACAHCNAAAPSNVYSIRSGDG
jgi:integrase